MGEHTVKNIARPVHVFRIDTGVEAADRARTTATGLLALPDRPSIAVLPFQNMSGDAEQDYFADGMVEDIITGLSRIKWLFVIARNSSFTYKGRAVDVKQVGRELGVRYVLEGSVRKAGNRVRITGQLIEAETGSASLGRPLRPRRSTTCSPLQDEITLSVVGAIEPSLRQAEIERVKRKRPDSLDAYDLVLRALPDVYAGDAGRGAEGAAAARPRARARAGLRARARPMPPGATRSVRARRPARREPRGGDPPRPCGDRPWPRRCHCAVAWQASPRHGRARPCRRARGFEAALALSPSCAFAYILRQRRFGWAGDAERAIEWGERGCV